VAQNQLTGLSCFFDFLVVRGRLTSNPLPGFLAGFRSRALLTRTLDQLPPETPVEELANRVRPARKAPFFRSALASLLEDYISHDRALGKRHETAVYQLRALDRVLLRHRVEDPGELTPAMVEEYLGANGPSARTRNKRLTQLRRFYRYLGRRELVTANPADACLAVPEPRFVPHIFSLREIGAILQEARQRRQSCRHPFTWRGIEVVLYLLYACGFRLSEPLKLRLCDVDLEEKLFFIARTKFYKQRWVPFGPGASRRLRSYLRRRAASFPCHNRPEDPVFLNTRGRVLRKARVQEAFREIRQSLALQGRGSGLPRLHDLRHTHAVHRLHKWYSEDEDVQSKLPLLSAYMGHVDIHSTQVYLHLTEDLLRRAGRKLENLFEGIVKPWSDAHKST
jgi:site-specific recombinase XerD